MTMLHRHVCDGCNRHGPASDDVDADAPAGWSFMRMPCGACVDACSVGCAKALLDKHADHTAHVDTATGESERPS